MKATIVFSFIIFLAIFLTGCENPIRMETTVHEDGSLDKTILLEKTDSVSSVANYFAVNEAKGWAVAVEAIKSDDEKKKFKIEFRKIFPSADAINKELDTDSDTLFRIHSSFNKSFRWFYTYIRYSETFRPIDRLQMIKAEEYFTPEDRLFINRLPGEGVVISKADSIFLRFLNEKIYDHYANVGLFNEQFDILTRVVEKNAVDKRWIDTLKRNREFIYRKMENSDSEPSTIIKVVDSLGIKLPVEKASQDFAFLAKDLNSRVSFMAFARDGKYVNIIEMPWTVVGSNADSVAGNKFFWRPLATKFAIQEYEMYAEVRRLNWWAAVVSALIVGLTLFLVMKR
jgi:hypothetical protein